MSSSDRTKKIMIWATARCNDASTHRVTKGHWR